MLFSLTDFIQTPPFGGAWHAGDRIDHAFQRIADLNCT